MRVDENIKAGCIVDHIPTGERWYILGVNKKKNKACAAGWPPTIAFLSDCVFVASGKLTDHELQYRNREFGQEWDDVAMGVEEC